MAHYDIFREQLGVKYTAYGHALWEPSPGKLYSPVEVGDVGYVREGKFHRLFNALLPADHPSHRRFGVPEYHEPLTPHTSEHIDTGTLSSDHYCSQGVVVDTELENFARRPEDLSEVLYLCRKRQQGAVLYLPVPAQRQDTIARGDFREWMIKHIERWFAFTQRLGLGLIHMGEIILVTGCDRTRSWVNVAFLESDTDSRVSFGVDVTPLTGDNEVAINWRFSPDRNRGAVLSRGPVGKDLPEDQCVFIRGYRVTRTLKIFPKQIKAAAEPSSDPDEHSSEPDLELTTIPANTKHRDPLHVLSEHIAERVPDCDLVLVHDDDLARIGEFCDGNETILSNSDTMIQLFQKFQPEIQQVLCHRPYTDEISSQIGIRATNVAMFSEEFNKWPPSSQSPSYGQSGRASVADSTTNKSIASSNLTDITTHSSLLDAGIGNARSSGAYGKSGTIRTVTTEATSFVPSEWQSMTRTDTEASAVAASISAGYGNSGGGDGNNYSPSSTSAGGTGLDQRRCSNLESPVRLRERRPSETVPVDLSRVVEESEEPTSGGGNSSRGVASGRPALANGRIERINLKQGKWPDDFLDALQSQNHVPSRPIAIRKPPRTPLSETAAGPPSRHDEFAFADLGVLSASASPSPEPYVPSYPTARRSTHRARHSVDTPVLAPRDSSPDPGTLGSGFPPSARVVPRQDSTSRGIAGQTLVMREEGKLPTHFQLGNCIGRGQFGSVYRALNLNTGRIVAMKRIGLEGLKEEEIAQLMHEVDLVKRLSHPSIVKYEGMARDENTLSIVLEYAENGSLGQTLKAFGKLNEKLVASYVVKILEGLAYLHCSDVVHCDLKAANILTTKTGNVKLSDFGVSLNLRAIKRKDIVGAPNWMAPEVIELKGASAKSDIWSLGCTVVELLTGRPPYGDIANAMTVMFRIVEDDCPPLPESFSTPLVAFLKECFHKDPAQRPNAEQLLEHEWLKIHGGPIKALPLQDSGSLLRQVGADMQNNDIARRFIANLGRDIVDSPVPESAHAGAHDLPPSIEPGNRLFYNASPDPEVPPVDDDVFELREHTFVKTMFSKPVSCRVCMEPVKKEAVLCSHCSLIAHSKCAGHAPPACNLRSKVYLHPQYPERGSPADLFADLPPPAASGSDGIGATSSRGSLDRGRPPKSIPLSAWSPPRPPGAHEVLSPFMRAHTSLSLDTSQSDSTSITLASGVATSSVSQQQRQQQRQQQTAGLGGKAPLSEGGEIGRSSSVGSSADVSGSSSMTAYSGAWPASASAVAPRPTLNSQTASAVLGGGANESHRPRRGRGESKSSNANCAIQ